MKYLNTLKNRAGADVDVNGHTHTKSEISDFPTSLPSSDVYAWAKAATKPAYTKSEVGLSNVANSTPATILAGLSSAQIATSLGFTPTNIVKGLYASMPLATGSPIQFYYATDQEKFYANYGGEWVLTGVTSYATQTVPGLLVPTDKITLDSLTGQLALFARQTAPAGWLKCNGALVSRTVYAGLFAVLGTIIGVGDGSTTFMLPDLRGEFMRGWDDGRGKDPGRIFMGGQGFAVQSHMHSYNINIQHSDGGYVSGEALTSGLQVTGKRRYVDETNVAGLSETRPTNGAALFCIKY